MRRNLAARRDRNTCGCQLAESIPVLVGRPVAIVVQAVAGGVWRLLIDRAVAIVIDADVAGAALGQSVPRVADVAAERARYAEPTHPRHCGAVGQRHATERAAERAVACLAARAVPGRGHLTHAIQASEPWLTPHAGTDSIAVARVTRLAPNLTAHTHARIPARNRSACGAPIGAAFRRLAIEAATHERERALVAEKVVFRPGTARCQLGRRRIAPRDAVCGRGQRAVDAERTLWADVPDARGRERADARSARRLAREHGALRFRGRDGRCRGNRSAAALLANADLAHLTVGVVASWWTLRQHALTASVPFPTDREAVRSRHGVEALAALRRARLAWSADDALCVRTQTVDTRLVARAVEAVATSLNANTAHAFEAGLAPLAAGPGVGLRALTSFARLLTERADPTRGRREVRRPRRACRARGALE
jgi:hypothetical protein